VVNQLNAAQLRVTEKSAVPIVEKEEFRAARCEVSRLVQA
jgi:hypothetical protein